METEKRVQEIETFIFLGMETTGVNLPRKITELSLLPIARKNMFDAEINGKKYIKTFRMNPEKSIEPTATKISGLTDIMVEREPKFSESIGKILSIIHEQVAPWCLVANNGIRYQFKTLIYELTEASKPIDNIWCVDSSEGFKRSQQERSAEEPVGNLSELYAKLFGSENELAETKSAKTCLMLYKCSREFHATFLPWADQNRRYLKDLRPYKNKKNKVCSQKYVTHSDDERERGPTKQYGDVIEAGPNQASQETKDATRKRRHTKQRGNAKRSRPVNSKDKQKKLCLDTPPFVSCAEDANVDRTAAVITEPEGGSEQNCSVLRESTIKNTDSSYIETITLINPSGVVLLQHYL